MSLWTTSLGDVMTCVPQSRKGQMYHRMCRCTRTNCGVCPAVKCFSQGGPFRVGQKRLLALCAVLSGRYGTSTLDWCGDLLSRLIVGEQRLATACLDGKVRIFDASTGRDLLTIPAHGDKTVNCVVFSPNGEHLLSGSYDKVSLVCALMCSGRRQTAAMHTHLRVLCYNTPTHAHTHADGSDFYGW